MNDGSVWYFAYGSNMDPARLKERCAGDGVEILERVGGRINGWRLVFNKRLSHRDGQGAANVIEDSEDLIEGTLNRMPPAGLDVLDRYEGVKKHQYRRHHVRVLRVDKDIEVDAVMYVALSSVVASGLRPSRQYLDHLLAGCDLLSKAYHDKLAATPVLD